MNKMSISERNSDFLRKSKNTYISNNCSNLHYYFKEEREYDHPFIGCLFVNDADYVRFCCNFRKYIKAVPRFDSPREDSVWAKQTGNAWYTFGDTKPGYPVMFLEDVEIHWIHETSPKELIEKYMRRMARLLNTNLSSVIFMLSCSDLCNDWTQEEYPPSGSERLSAYNKLISSFLSLPNSVYLCKDERDLALVPQARNRIRLVERWRNIENKRDEKHNLLIHTTGERMDDYTAVIAQL